MCNKINFDGSSSKFCSHIDKCSVKIRSPKSNHNKVTEESCKHEKYSKNGQYIYLDLIKMLQNFWHILIKA